MIVVRIAGEIDTSNAAEIGSVLSAHAARTLVVDLDGVQFLEGLAGA